MQATAYQNVRCRRPIYSVSIYCRREDQIRQSALTVIARGLLQELGLLGHQAIIIGTIQKAPSIHMVVNRINPQTCRAAPLSHDHLLISNYAQRTERIYHLAREERRLFNNAIRKQGNYIESIRYHSPSKTRWTTGQTKRKINRKIAAIAWTTKEIEEAIEYCADRNHLPPLTWVTFSDHLADFGLVIEWRDGNFVVLNPVNGQSFIINEQSTLYDHIRSLFDEWANLQFQLLPITKKRRKWDKVLRSYFGLREAR
jgi:hypothetical protein